MDTSKPDALLEATNLHVQYGKAHVLQDITLRIEEGEFVGLVGPNGAGKSTLLRSLLGLVEPSNGEVRCYGRPVHRFDDWTRIGYVPQHAVNVDAAFPANALEIALLGRVAKRGLFRRWSAEDKSIASDALARVGVDHLADRPVGTLSGGERQRVFLAKALAGDPDLLVLDEPTAGVDMAAREDFYNLIDGLNHEEGITILLVSHDLQAVQLCCHRLIALNHRIVYDGTPEAFDEEGGISRAYDMHVSHHPERGGGHP